MTELERRLIDLAETVEFPASADLVSAVGTELTRRRAPRRALRPLPIAAVFVLLATLVVLSFPGSRHAVVDWLGVRGLEITFGPSPSDEVISRELDLGERIDLEEVTRRAAFRILLPNLLNGPDVVFFDGVPPGGHVALVYRPGREVPEVGATGVGVLVTQFRGGLTGDFFEKRLGPEAELRLVEVRGATGYWVRGEHVFMYHGSDELIREESIRLAGNALVWEEEGVTIRIESGMELERVLDIARSMEPLG